MATCEKTGAIVYFPDYNAWANGDMHIVGDCWVFYACPKVHATQQPAPRRADFSVRLNGKTFSRETMPYEVYVLPSECVVDLRMAP